MGISRECQLLQLGCRSSRTVGKLFHIAADILSAIFFLAFKVFHNLNQFNLKNSEHI